MATTARPVGLGAYSRARPAAATTSTAGGILWFHAKWYFAPILTLCLIAIVTIAVGYAFAANGSLGGVSVTMLVAQFTTALLAGMWVNQGIVTAWHLFRGQVGGAEEGKEEGLSLADGIRAAEKGLPGYWNTVLEITLWVAAPFLVLFFFAWLGREYVSYAAAALPFIFGVVVWVIRYFHGSVFAWVIGFAEVAVMAALWGPPAVEGVQRKLAERQAAQAASAPVNVRTGREAQEAELAYLRQQAADCFNGLKNAYAAAASAPKSSKLPTAKEKADCQEKQAAVIAAETGVATPASPASAAAQGPAAPTTLTIIRTPAVPATTHVASATGYTCDGPSQQIDFEPPQGPKEISQKAGVAYTLVASGYRKLRFSSGDICEIAPDGMYGTCTRPDGSTYKPTARYYKVPGDSNSPFKDKAFYALVLRLPNGQPVWVGNGLKDQVIVAGNGGITLGTNAHSHLDGGVGPWSVTLRQCRNTAA